MRLTIEIETKFPSARAIQVQKFLGDVVEVTMRDGKEFNTHRLVAVSKTTGIVELVDIHTQHSTVVQLMNIKKIKVY